MLLDRTTWDICLDASGNIAVCTEPYAIAQDAACAVKTFLGECWYDTSLGVPYFEQILGQYPGLAYMREQFIAAALTVPGALAAQCFFDEMVGRTLSGQLQIDTGLGETAVVGF